MSNTETKMINLQETVSILGVSTATIRNWIKHNYITLGETRKASSI
jgi:hypothetical protein